MGKLSGIARRDRKRGDMQLLEAAEITEAEGVARDFRGRPGKRQVTVLSSDVWQTVCAELDRELPWTTRRSNLLVEGVDLPREAGAILQIGGVRLEVTCETDPCSRMDDECPGLRAALTPDWRGGVCCRVLSGGNVAIGDMVRVDAAPGD